MGQGPCLGWLLPGKCSVSCGFKFQVELRLWVTSGEIWLSKGALRYLWLMFEAAVVGLGFKF